MEPKRLLAASPIISEFVASNASTLNDGYGDSSDWIELTNVGTSPVDLAGYHLSDSAGEPTKWAFSETTLLQPGEHLIVFASSRDVIDPSGFNHTNFKLSAGGEYLSLADPAGTVLSAFGSSSEDYPPQFTDISYGRLGGSLVSGQSVAQYLVPTAADASLGTTWTANGFDALANGFAVDRASVGYENSPQDSVNYIGQFETDIPVGTTSVYVRTEFELADASVINDLTLTMNYDDGFAVYLNGTFLFSRNAPSSLAWNSFAQQTHGDVDALRPASFGLDGRAGAEGNYLDLLVDGTNTLAIHSLNVPNSSDMLMVPRLVSSSAPTLGSYLLSPSPGETNTAAVTLGPLVEDVTPSGTVVDPGQPLLVTAKISDFSSPVNRFSARLNYRVMFGGEVSIVMNDSGLGNDVLAMDGIYSATIPAAAFSAGQMLRWYVSVNDIDGNTTRAPRFIDPLNSPEYFGTVVTDPSIDTDLPLLQWFLQDTNAATTDVGARGSLFFNGEFYDNIQTDGHGQSTRGPEFPKKSFDFDANSGEKFLIADGYKASDFNLLTNYADQTKLRQTLGYEAFGQAGLATHLAFSVSVYRNGEFYGLFDLVEEGDEEYLDRNGLDPNGALYKVNNPLSDAYVEVEKKSREYEDHSDFQEVVNATGLRGSSAATWFFDHLDIADVINYLVTQNLIASIDFGHKNMYWYHDVEGTGLWSVLPWDQDLSFGHTWTQEVNPPYFDNRLRENQTLYQALNPMFQQIYANPTLRQMYDRRMRTLADQLLGESGTAVSESYLAQRIDNLEASITDEAVDDRNLWGVQANFAVAYPFNAAQASDQLRDTWILSQRNHIDNQFSIPDSQLADPAIRFDDTDFDASPVSGLQSEEYLRLRNNTGAAVDLSGWELTGGIEHTFKGGTVIPAGGSLYVVADVVAFQNRSTGPRGGQQRFIQGNYRGQLSSNGEVVNLVSSSGATIDTLAIPAEAASDKQQFLRITEFSYHPNDPAGNAEYIEFTNTSSGANATALDLSGVTISEGPSSPFVFAANTIVAPGSRVLVVKDIAAFTAHFPTADASLIVGSYSGSLSNGGETIRVDDVGGERIFEFTYGDSDPWSPIADGSGGALQLVNEFSTSIDVLDKFYSWRGTYREGTPGAAARGPNANVVISEVLAHTDLPQVDFIELQNLGGSAIDVGGWYLSDSRTDLRKYQIPASTIIAAGGFVVFDESDFNPTPSAPGPNDFALFSGGDDVWLTSTLGGQTTFIDNVSFGATFNGESVGPVLVSGGRLSPLRSPTPGGINHEARVGPVLISEVNYHPSDPSASALAIEPTLSAGDLEFVEIHNPSSAAVPLADWQLRGGVDYDLDAISIAAGETMLVLSFNPSLSENSSRLAAFRAHYDIGVGVPLVGGYDGALSNSFDRVELQQPDTPNPLDPTDIPHVTSDEVLYDDRSPWPDADGNGQSLQRIAGKKSGNRLSSWIAGVPSPGIVSLVADAPVVVSITRDGGGELPRPDLIETLAFTFDIDVTLSADGLLLRNLSDGGASVDLSDAEFSYDATNRTATWDLSELSSQLPAAFYEVTIPANEVQAVGSGLGMANDVVAEVYVALLGDANLDGVVDVLSDGFTLVSNLGANVGAAWEDGDFNNDGRVDVLNDGFVVVGNLGRSVVPSVESAAAVAAFSLSNDPVPKVAAASNSTAALAAVTAPGVDVPKAIPVLATTGENGPTLAATPQRLLRLDARVIDSSHGLPMLPTVVGDVARDNVFEELSYAHERSTDRRGSDWLGEDGAFDSDDDPLGGAP